MPQKIQIIKLEKTSEYLKKEIDAVKSIKNKLLKDSDWTQILDSELLISDRLRWRHWRHLVRSISATAINYDQSAIKLEELSLNKPNDGICTGKYSFSPQSQFDYTSLQTFIQSSETILREIFKTNEPDARIKGFNSRAKRLLSIDSVLELLIEVIEDGY